MTFEEFVAERLDWLLRFARVLCNEPTLAEDVVQEVLLRAHQQWERVGAADSVPAYVRTMVVNEFLASKRKSARWTLRAEVEPTRRVADHAEQQADRSELVTLLDGLPRQQRAAVVLRYYSDLPDADIAVALGCSSGTVRSHLSRALATMRVQLTSDRAGELAPSRAEK